MEWWESIPVSWMDALIFGHLAHTKSKFYQQKNKTKMYSIYAYPPPKKKEVMVKKKFTSETREEAFLISKSLQMEGYINVQICEIDRKR